MAKAKITPFLWFDDQAEQAMRFYVSIFPNSKIHTVNRYGDAGPGKKGSVMTVAARVAGQELVALNGGPHYELSPAFSLFVSCKNQREVDTLWRKLLSGGGRESMCGWLTDRFGLSWQIVPDVLMELLGDNDRARANRAMQAMLGMRKLDIQALRDAADGKIAAKKPRARSRRN
ncbi:MAG: VOC family protein [Deltaproteobacteria bacterium]|nr:VOC family protein [Deltaproteobacteria bacterium]